MPTGAGSDAPNVLFVMTDEHSFRYLGRRDDGLGEPVETPALDDLAASATVFDSAYCPYPLCVPSRRCLLTGKEAPRIDAWSDRAVIGDHETLPGAFSAAGYDTCLSGKMHFGGDHQFGGFDHRPYGDITGDSGENQDPIDPEKLDTGATRQGIDRGTRIPRAGVTEVPETQLQEQLTAGEAVSWLRERDAAGDQPWFCCASFMRPHFPLTAPPRHFERYWPDGVTEPRVGREGDSADHPHMQWIHERFGLAEFDEEEHMRARAGYFACVSYVDEILGDFLSTLERGGLLEDTIVVYTSDHGEYAAEHGLWWKNGWHETASRVPLFVSTPAQRRGDADAHTVETPVSLLDLFPTLCSLAGVSAPDDLDGVDLSESVLTGAEPDRDPVVVDNVGSPADYAQYRMVRDGRWKYVHYPDAPDLLFDLEADPDETENLASDAEGELAAVRDRLRESVVGTVDFEAIAAASRRENRSEENDRHGLDHGSGNAYLLPDGRLVDAGASIYYPRVLADEPANVFEDYPEDAPTRR
jgi:choline-sulfatase